MADTPVIITKFSDPPNYFPGYPSSLGKNNQGKDGKDGVSISDAVINESTGNLILTLSDGKIVDAGKATGLNGINGKDGKDASSIAPSSTKTAAYTLVLNDSSSFIKINTITDVVVTLPNNLPEGFQVAIIQMGDGVVTFTPANGATRYNRAGFTKTAGKFAIISLMVIANIDGNSAQYVLTGDGSV